MSWRTIDYPKAGKSETHYVTDQSSDVCQRPAIPMFQYLVRSRIRDRKSEEVIFPDFASDCKLLSTHHFSHSVEYLQSVKGKLEVESVTELYHLQRTYRSEARPNTALDTTIPLSHAIADTFS